MKYSNYVKEAKRNDDVNDVLKDLRRQNHDISHRLREMEAKIDKSQGNNVI
jgi:hypothetical protein